MRRTLSGFGLFITIAFSAVAAAAQATAPAGENGNRFEWTGVVPAGAWIVVRNVNGPVSVTATSSRTAGITGLKRAERGGDPSVVHFVSRPLANGGILVCALWGATADCDEDGYHSHVNGSIEVELPATLNADVELRTVNGGFETDFPMMLSGRVSPRHLSGKIGSGGRELRATTVNGSINLRKSS